MPDELADATNPDGSLQFAAGSIAIHLISLAFAQRLTRGKGDRLELPFHRAEKKVPHIDPATGSLITPNSPNAIKLEHFIFDAIPLAKHSIILETDRVEEFAPIKNAEGSDSPGSSQKLQTERAARWLEAHGVHIPRNENGEVDAVIEISPLSAISLEDLAHIDLPKRIEAGTKVIL
jgi:UDP-N-acetylglucosamine/UDP-N-acetylgalactosamine diphosphorylase